MVAAVTTDVSQGTVLAAAAYPAIDTKVSQAEVLAAAGGLDMLVSQVFVLVAAAGRVSDPKVRTWTFSLDGHEFYVLRLGNIETLVYDVTNKLWYEWGSDDSAVWEAYTGASWYAGRNLGIAYGTNVVVGSSSNGSLYFLSPLDDEDDDAVLGAELKRPFMRRITAQATIASGYDFTPCFGVQAFGSVGQSATNGTAELTYSDDRGTSYQTGGALTVDAGDLDFRLEWPSLGSMSAPGRLFRLTDYGALRRIDGLEMVVPDNG